ncbi:hypothetical protein HKBW3S43_00775 [Candidatus Hakubella thermalkaliphila]|uniref:Uncharacterized protein n=1 Tax=Candidatus Hakubella thermalkaliphila TaxID=2754717 RepID=A0A6V8NSJ6_9ACTN|nr:hypothetical protein HKBW3S06_01468 [Candidatus Hakubella thermalkaliphila]GFP28077.1 hypothetical protein HKBW3S33_01494 [Candidatus Hakubella thermalkaliphila]GFP34983.1 hypothetical protein HKBW3S43_00775 [Candidatus Hakubella thermalkaliphila]
MRLREGSPSEGTLQRLQEVFVVTGSVKYSMYFHSLPTDNVEDKIVLDNQNSISCSFQLWISGNSTWIRMNLKTTNLFFDPLDELQCSCWAIFGNVIENVNKVIIGCRKIAERILTFQGVAFSTSASSVRG